MPNIPITEVYQPLPKQDAFHQSTAPYRLHVGGYGSGKTLNLLWEAIITCRMVPGSNSLILRTTSPDIQKTVINKFLNPKMVPRWVYESYNKNEKIAYFDNGSQLHFGYCAHDDDINQFLSTEYVFIGLEEAGEFSYRVWEHLVGRARVAKNVLDVNGNSVQPSMGLTTNPYGNGWGWIKSLFIDKKPVKGMGTYNPNDYWYVHSTVVDNPYVYTPEYVKKLEAMTGTLRAQALYGDMDVVGGQYYPQFNTGQHKDIHVMDAKNIRFRKWEPIWIGSDWDGTHWPVIWFTKASIPDKIMGWRTVTVAFRELMIESKDPTATINTLQAAQDIVRACKYKCSVPACKDDEWCKLGHTPVKIVEPIKHFYFSWERFMRQGMDHSIAEQLGSHLAKYGVPRPSQADNSRVDGWVLISQLFDFDELIITSNCYNLIEAIPQLIHDTPDDPYDVKKIAGEADDLADAFRYGVKSYMNPGRVPQSVRDASALDQIKDPIARQIRAYEQYCRNQAPKTAVKDTRKLAWELGR